MNRTAIWIVVGVGAAAAIGVVAFVLLRRPDPVMAPPPPPPAPVRGRNVGDTVVGVVGALAPVAESILNRNL